MEENTTNKNAQEAPENDVVVDEVNSTPAEEQEADNVVAEGADEELSEEAKLQKEVDELKRKLDKAKNDELYLRAEFDNFPQRTLKEKSDLIKNAAESAFKGLLPVVDDMERALVHSDDTTDPKTLREGMEVPGVVTNITKFGPPPRREGQEPSYTKLKKYLAQNGGKEMETTGNPFDADKAEAIAMVPAQSDDQKGKVIDTVEKGYTITDKVLRHAKVVVCQ